MKTYTITNGDLASCCYGRDTDTMAVAETLLHMDEYIWDDLYMDDQMLEYFRVKNIDDIIEYNNEEGYGLTKAEIQELKEEHGLEAEEIEETVS